MGSNSSIPLSCFCRRRLACEGDAIEKNKSEKEKKKKKEFREERRNEDGGRERATRMNSLGCRMR